jgi:glutaredoxin
VPMEVTLLTQENCAFCDQAGELLERLSAEYGFSVRELDLNSPEGRVLAWHGGVMFRPGIFIDGDPFCYGRPSERKLRRELDRRLEPVRRDQ